MMIDVMVMTEVMMMIEMVIEVMMMMIDDYGSEYGDDCG